MRACVEAGLPVPDRAGDLQRVGSAGGGRGGGGGLRTALVPAGAGVLVVAMTRLRLNAAGSADATGHSYYGARMADNDDVARLVAELPEVSVGERYGHPTWSVGGKAFAWVRPFSKADVKRFGSEAPPSGPILAVRVADLHEKEAVLAERDRGSSPSPTSTATPPSWSSWRPLRPTRCATSSSTPGWPAPRPRWPTTTSSGSGQRAWLTRRPDRTAELGAAECEGALVGDQVDVARGERCTK